jgi:hypothetical protein
MAYTANEQIGIAVADNPAGPFVNPSLKPIDESVKQIDPFISRRIAGENGTGHGDILTTGDGRLLYVFHTHSSKETVSPRKTAIAEIRFVKDKQGKTDRLVFDRTTFRFLYCKTH